MLEFHVSLDSIIQVSTAITAVLGVVYAYLQVRSLRKTVRGLHSKIEERTIGDETDPTH